MQIISISAHSDYTGGKNMTSVSMQRRKNVVDFSFIKCFVRTDFAHVMTRIIRRNY